VASGRVVVGSWPNDAGARASGVRTFGIPHPRLRRTTHGEEVEETSAPEQKMEGRQDGRWRAGGGHRRHAIFWMLGLPAPRVGENLEPCAGGARQPQFCGRWGGRGRLSWAPLAVTSGPSCERTEPPIQGCGQAREGTTPVIGRGEGRRGGHNPSRAGAIKTVPSRGYSSD
jgi:hypothetical protein